MKVRPVKKQNEPEKIEISSEFIKLDSFLKLCGAAMTGGEAKLAVIGGEVAVNGEPCLMRGKKLRPGDLVGYKGRSYLVAGKEA